MLYVDSLSSSLVQRTAEPHSSIGSVADLRTGRWLDPGMANILFED